VFTHHQAVVKSYLPYLRSQTKGILRLARFLPTVKLECKPGRTNMVADALSRAPVGGPIVSAMSLIKRVQKQQNIDEDVKQMLKYVSDFVIAKKIVSQAHKRYYAVDGVLYHEDASMPSRKRLVPVQLRDQVLLENHDAPYVAPKKMYDKVKQYYYWPGMKGDIYHKCSNCVTCASV